MAQALSLLRSWVVRPSHGLRPGLHSVAASGLVIAIAFCVQTHVSDETIAARRLPNRRTFTRVRAQRLRRFHRRRIRSRSHRRPALALLKHSDLPTQALDRLSRNSGIMKSRKVKLALVEHPRTPRHISIPMVRHLFTFDLMQVALTPVVPADIKMAAEESPHQPAGKTFARANGSPSRIAPRDGWPRPCCLIRSRG